MIFREVPRRENILENILEREPKKKVTKIVMEFMRHGKREKGATPSEDENPDLRLTLTGRVQADARGRELNPQAEVSLGWGSDKTRTKETFFHVMGKKLGIEVEDTFEDIKEKIKKLQPVGKKMIQDERLGFSVGGPIGEDAAKAYYEKRYMPWLIQESDALALEKKDEISSCYTRTAGKLAEILLRYIEVGNNFQRLIAEDANRKYEQYGNRLERYLGTHQGVSESLVAKVLELTWGEETKNAFVKSVGAGFDEIEGVRFEIVNRGKEQKILMTYSVKEGSVPVHKTVEFGREVVENIIEERKAFERKINPDWQE